MNHDVKDQVREFAEAMARSVPEIELHDVLEDAGPVHTGVVPIRRRLSGPAVAVLAAVAVAVFILVPGLLLTGPASVQPVSAPTTQPNVLSTPQDGDEVAYHERFMERLPAILVEASSFQTEILADGLVTEDEQRTALDAFVSCVEDEGGRVIGLQLYPNGLIQQYSIAGDNGSYQSAEEADTIAAACKTEYYSFIEEGRRATIHPDWTESWELQQIAECLQEAGVNVADQPSDWAELKSDAGRNLEDLYSCNDEVQGSS
jgi:hypothetical protein